MFFAILETNLLFGLHLVCCLQMISILTSLKCSRRVKGEKKELFLFGDDQIRGYL